jgi:photosystem II stability/assembly factor-like uncharacterized protein
MKTILLKKSILLAGLFSFLNAGAQWSTLNTGIQATILELSAPSQDTIFFSAEKLYRSMNGGQTFDTINLPRIIKVTHISYFDRSNVVVSGLDPELLIARIFKSADAGNTWIEITPPQFTRADEVAFSDAMHGVALITPEFPMQEGYYFYTQDGGTSWDMLGPYDGLYFKNVLFNGGTGYAIAHTFNVDVPDRVMKSVDGGRTWNKIFDSPDTLNTLEAILFTSKTNGFVLSNDIKDVTAKIFFTNDGGETWVTRRFTHGNILAFSFVDAKNGLVISDNGVIYNTIDGGITWNEDRLTDTDLQVISSVGEIAFAGGLNGKLLKRSPGTGIWEPVSGDREEAYPNPSNGNVFIPTSNFGQQINIEITDITGKIILKKSYSSNSGIIVLEELEKGIFMVTLKDENNKQEVYRILIE